MLLLPHYEELSGNWWLDAKQMEWDEQKNMPKEAHLSLLKATFQDNIEV